jgi:hypothetical protein
LKTYDREADALMRRISRTSESKLVNPEVITTHHTNALAHATQIVFPGFEPVWRIPRIWPEKNGAMLLETINLETQHRSRARIP